MNDKGLSDEEVYEACKDGDPMTKVRLIMVFVFFQIYMNQFCLYVQDIYSSDWKFIWLIYCLLGSSGSFLTFLRLNKT